jgi:hypothetical protein
VKVLAGPRLWIHLINTRFQPGGPRPKPLPNRFNGFSWLPTDQLESELIAVEIISIDPWQPQHAVVCDPNSVLNHKVRQAGSVDQNDTIRDLGGEITRLMGKGRCGNKGHPFLRGDP